jgi:hypothetical protein
LALGAGMNARGVIEVIVAMVGLRLGILNTASYTIVVLTAVVTSLMAPPLLRLATGGSAPASRNRRPCVSRNRPPSMPESWPVRAHWPRRKSSEARDRTGCGYTATSTHCWSGDGTEHPSPA